MPLSEEISARLSDDEREAVYKCIFGRRDVRGQFLPDPVPDAVLARLLKAAHHAPSVGFMQPWDFILVSDPELKSSIRDAFKSANEEAAGQFSEQRQQTYKSLKLEGITDSPLGICVTCDRNRTGETVLGRTHQPQMDLFSAVCAVQNFWLAARAENVGVGWVSIIEPDRLRKILGIPPEIEIIAYLCVGYVSHFLDKPELESRGWLPRRALEDTLWFNGWRKRHGDEPILNQI